MKLEQLIGSTNEPWVIATSRVKVVEELVDWCDLPNRRLAEFDAAKLKTLDALFDAFSSRLEFPSYFGRNLNAFDECMNDLSWLTESVIVILLTNADDLLSEELNLLDWF